MYSVQNCVLAKSQTSTMQIMPLSKRLPESSCTPNYLYFFNFSPIGEIGVGGAQLMGVPLSFLFALAKIPTSLSLMKFTITIGQLG